jgi:glycosyltransferase involved in cell wall biosynthesis
MTAVPPPRPRVSVVIPVWNDSVFLETCLGALARQSRPADEIVVVDNNSTDDSAQVARRHGVRVVEQPVQGIAPASAAGFDAASGDLIARLDADSIPPVDWLERIEMLAIAAGPLTVITGPGDFYGSGSFARWAGRNLYLGGFFRLFRLILGHYPIFGSNFMMSRELWLRVRGNVHRNHGAIHDDIDLSYQLEPDMQVQLEPSLVVGISGRPLASFGAFYRRAFWVRTTLRLDFRDLSPIRRRRLRRAWNDRTGSGASAFASAAPRTGHRAIR